MANRDWPGTDLNRARIEESSKRLGAHRTKWNGKLRLSFPLTRKDGGRLRARRRTLPRLCLCGKESAECKVHLMCRLWSTLI